MSFVKLDSGIIASSLWQEPYHVRLVWITMLAQCDAQGYVSASLPGLAHLANVTMDECVEAVKVLSGPDPHSRTPDYEGRRMEAVDGGYIILNYSKYRIARDAEERREYMREYMRNRRKQDVNSCKHPLAMLAKAEAEGDVEADVRENKIAASQGTYKGQSKGGGRFTPPTAEEVSEYAKSIDFQDFDPQQFVDFYASKGWMIGKSPMKDWQAAVRTWKRGQNAPKPRKILSPEVLDAVKRFNF
jgi:hypothetical protein